MHGPDGKNYPNENIFQEISKPNKVVIRHDGNPYFTATLSIDDVAGGAIINWSQDFDDEEVAMTVANIVEPANEQLMDKLLAVVVGG